MSESDKVLTNIFRVDVQVKEMRISLDVAGEHPDGCEYPVIVNQTRRGNTVDVEVYREVPADVICPMILKPYSDTINLEGDYEAGDYTINVNYALAIGEASRGVNSCTCAYSPWQCTLCCLEVFRWSTRKTAQTSH